MAGSRSPVPSSPEEGETVEEVDADTALVLSGRMPSAGDRRLLASFGAQVIAMLPATPSHLCCSPSAGSTSSRQRSMDCQPTGSGFSFPRTCPRSKQTPECWNALSRTSPKSPSNTPPIRTSFWSGSWAGKERPQSTGNPAVSCASSSRAGVDTDKILAIFRPVQRLSDNPAATGIGLGLAAAKGFTEAMSGTLTAEQTPGGGLTMVISQQDILVHVWGDAYAGETQYLRVFIAQLRRKLEPDPANPTHLLTETGRGYRFEK